MGVKQGKDERESSMDVKQAPVSNHRYLCRKAETRAEHQSVALLTQDFVLQGLGQTVNRQD